MACCGAQVAAEIGQLQEGLPTLITSCRKTTFLAYASCKSAGPTCADVILERLDTRMQEGNTAASFA